MSRLAGVNLNLLVALDALLIERSVGRAAQRIGVTQSAMSHTLRQLRELFEDPLLVRAGRSMVLTPRAEELRPALHAALDSLETLVGQRGSFEPDRYEGRFTLATQDGVVAALSPKLFQDFRDQAPRAELRILRPPTDLAEALGDGRVDLATATPMDVPGGLVQEAWGPPASWAVICDRDHPAQTMDVESFCRWPHAMMSLTGEGPSFVDHALGRLGKKRTIAVRVPFLLALPHLIQGTDLLAVVVAEAAEGLQRLAPLKQFPVPSALGMPSLPMTMLWHGRHEADPAHAWFRSLVKGAWAVA